MISTLSTFTPKPLCPNHCYTTRLCIEDTLLYHPKRWNASSFHPLSDPNSGFGTIPPPLHSTLRCRVALRATQPTSWRENQPTPNRWRLYRLFVDTVKPTSLVVVQERKRERPERLTFGFDFRQLPWLGGALATIEKACNVG